MNLKDDLRWLILIAVAAFAIFANTLGGDFVYDDNRQIALNPLIQNPELYGKALTSDVWAFKGDGTIAASNYWRPTFTAWCILNFWLFGPDPFGWHLLNIALHIGVCLMAYLLLRRWGLSELVSFAIAFIFAVHPVHTESVAWIAGSPDLLFALALLVSLWFADRAADARGKSRMKYLVSAVVFYFLALGAKEVAFFCFPIFYLIFAKNRVSETAGKVRADTAVFVTFGAVALGYFLTRWAILGRISVAAEGAAPPSSIILSAPEIFAFYLRQIMFPLWLGPNYGLRPIEFVSLANLILPLFISIIAACCIWVLSKRSFVQKIGAALFILPLLSIFNITAFLREQIVHDRYLYLPLLGFLMMVVPFTAELLKKYFDDRAEKLLAASAIIICIPLAFQTFTYNRVWQNELALWQHAIVIDPESSFNWSQLGYELSEQGRTDQAIDAYNRSLSIAPRPLAYIGRARILIRRGVLDTPIRDLRAVIDTSPDKIDAYALYQAYEMLAFALQSQQSLDEAEKVIRDGRKRLPIYQAAMTEKLAVVLYLQNRKQEALNELEAAKPYAKNELLPASKLVFLRLGMLYAELGNRPAAIENLNIFLQNTTSAKDNETEGDRRQAMEMLKRLNS